MKKLLLLTLNILISIALQAQGLEQIIVEKYYIADKNDAEASNGLLKKGAVTYRIYADMKPGYRFQAVFGLEGHPMIIETSTGFYNHPDYGGNVANIVPERIMPQHLAMLDSWLSVGAASELSMGILKEEDDTVNTIRNTHKPVMLLQNDSKKSGFPLKERDGLINKGEVPRVNGFGIDNLITLFDKDINSKAGVRFYTENGSWACLAGSTGPKETNRVLLAQLTTDGKFYYEFNIQLGNPDGTTTERYVARNPAPGEFSIPSLIYNR